MKRTPSKIIGCQQRHYSLLKSKICKFDTDQCQFFTPESNLNCNNAYNILDVGWFSIGSGTICSLHFVQFWCFQPGSWQIHVLTTYLVMLFSHVGILFMNVSFCTLRYWIAEQDLISKQGGKFRKINKRAGLNKQAGWKISKNLIKEQDWINEQVGIIIQIHINFFGKF